MRRVCRAAAAISSTALAAAVLVLCGQASTLHSSAAAAGKADRPLIVLHPGALHAVFTPSTAPLTTARCEARFRIACYQPAQIRAAYRLPELYASGFTGTGQTIIVVDSFGSPTLRHDLAVFDHRFGLAAPPELSIRHPDGPVPAYDPHNAGMVGWAGETDLDVEYAHAVAPDANIVVVVTPTAENEGTSGFPQIVKAEKDVIARHIGGVISQSFSATENSFPTHRALLALRGAYTDAASHGVTVLAASGDSGAAGVGPDGSTYYLHPVTSWPATDPLVTAVGGTRLQLNAAGQRRAPDTAWNDTYSKPAQRYISGSPGPAPLASGGGTSSVFARPSYQDGVSAVVGGHRGVPDISMSAACDGAVDMYQSFRGQRAGWYPTCGTSEATPMFAGIVALADQVARHPLGPINHALYAMSTRHDPGIKPVTRGSNTVSFRQHGQRHTVKGFRAGTGYSLATGVGTISAPAFVRELASLAEHTGPAHGGTPSAHPAPPAHPAHPVQPVHPVQRQMLAGPPV
jgi:subtilase family serine protease